MLAQKRISMHNKVVIINNNQSLTVGKDSLNRQEPKTFQHAKIDRISGPDRQLPAQAVRNRYLYY